ncbi:MAG: hypothetical protein GEU75_02885 [Dehalococcoidia bacterium]|nr:hypothetical protein [Dehalococcoidia bacterium]
MTRTYSDLAERQALEVDTSLVKTYLVEAHRGDEDPAALARRSFADLAAGVGARVHDSDEPALVTVEAKIRDEIVFAYVDFTNPRFWLIHSMASSNAIDWLMNRALLSPELDRAWLPANLLEFASSLGSFRGLGLDYDRRVLHDIDLEQPDAPVGFLKMQLWGNKASDVLRVLREPHAFPSETTLAKVKVKFWLDGANQEVFTLDDIKYDGKITARGTDFASHIGLTTTVYGVYERLVVAIEDEFGLEAVSEGGFLSLHGEPINVFFSRPVSNLKSFCEGLCSAAPPFRIWGVPTAVGNAFYRIHAVDLHVGCQVMLEVTKDFARVFLPAGSCGNTVLRLVTNLQHHYDALVQAQSGAGENVLGI